MDGARRFLLSAKKDPSAEAVGVLVGRTRSEIAAIDATLPFDPQYP